MYSATSNFHQFSRKHCLINVAYSGPEGFECRNQTGFTPRKSLRHISYHTLQRPAPVMLFRNAPAFGYKFLPNCLIFQAQVVASLSLSASFGLTSMPNSFTVVPQPQQGPMLPLRTQPLLPLASQDRTPHSNSHSEAPKHRYRDTFGFNTSSETTP